MKKIILASLFVVLTSLACMQSALSTLTATPLVTSTALPELTATPLASPTALPTVEISCARVTADSLHVRYNATYHSGIMGWFVVDTPLTVRREYPGWTMVNGPGVDLHGRKTRMTGFVKSEWIQVEACDVQQAAH